MNWGQGQDWDGVYGNGMAIAMGVCWDPAWPSPLSAWGHPLRPQPQAVRLESAQPQRVRYLLVVRPEEEGAEGQTALLGVDFPHEG